jgi:hypothetical protein
MAEVIRIKQAFGSSSDLSQAQSEWDERYLVELSGNPEEPEWIPILSARPEWSIGGKHPTVPFARVADFSSKQAGNSWVYEVVVRYERLPSERRKPLEQRAVITMRSELVEEPVYLDEDDKPLLNTAGELLLGVTDEAVHWVFSVTVNLPGYPKWLLEYPGAVNLDAVRLRGLTIAPGHLRMTGLQLGDLQEEDEQQFYTLSAELKFVPGGWSKRVLNRGLYELVTRTVSRNGEPVEVTVRERCKDDDGEPEEEPVFLDRQGRRPRTTVTERRPDGSERQVSRIKSPLDPDDIVVLTKWPRRRKRRSFAPLTFLR